MTIRIHTQQTAVTRLGALALVLCLPLVLCSCRTISQSTLPMPPAPAEEPEVNPVQRAEHVSKNVVKSKNIKAEPVCDAGVPIPMVCDPPWSPPGIAGPWPKDEYLEDGGDREVQVNVTREGDVQGLELEDTVAIYDTVDGETKIKPSNRVCLYAPRFAAVRKVTSVIQTEQRDQLVAVDRPLGAYMHQDDQLATTAIQPIQPEGELGIKQPSIERSKEVSTPAISGQPISSVNGELALQQYQWKERERLFEESETARLLEMRDAAVIWSHDKAVQVVLEGTAAVSVTGEQKVQETFRIDTPNSPCLRIIKMASTKTARPGDLVEFTLRFDNQGDQTIKRVVIIDNLTTRLEYVPDSSQSSRPSVFTQDVNSGDSLTLRWEFNDPLPVGAGGLIHFQCRVR